MPSDIVIPKWLDKKFIEKALREGDKNDNIIVRKINVKPATSSGDNYGSIILRVTAEYSINSGYGDNIYIKSLIVKSVPEEEKAKHFMTENDSFSTETEVLRTLIPSFHRLLKNSSEKHVNFSAKYYYHTDKPDQKLVLGDLCESGFRMAEKRSGLDMDHCKLVLSRLGQFHAASFALHHQDPHSFDSFLKHPHAKASDAIQNILQYTFRLSANDLEASSSSGRQYSEKLRELGRNPLARFLTSVERDEEGFNVLNHGDLWKNNIMFYYNEDGTVTDVTFVDFQFAYYGSPVIDLQFFIYSSSKSEVLSNHLDQLLDCYHSSLSQTISRLGYGDQCPSLDDIRDEMEKRNFMTVFPAVSVMPLTLVKADNVPDVSEAIDNKVEQSIGHITEESREAILKLLPIFDKKGWLD